MEQERKKKIKSIKRSSKNNSIFDGKQGGKNEIQFHTTQEALKSSKKLDLNYKKLTVKELRKSLLHAFSPKTPYTQPANLNTSDISQISNTDSNLKTTGTTTRMFPPIFSSLVRRNIPKNRFSSFFGKQNKVVPMNNQDYIEEIETKTNKNISTGLDKSMHSGNNDQNGQYNPVLQTDVSVDDAGNKSPILDKYKSTVSQFANKSFDNNLLKSNSHEEGSYSNRKKSDSDSGGSDDNQDKSHMAINKKNFKF